VIALVVAFMVGAPHRIAAQRLLERTTNLPNSVTALPGFLEVSLPHRFTDFGGAAGLETSTTFDLALGLPWFLPVHWTAGVRFAPNSAVGEDSDEWEAYDRLGVLRQGRGAPVDVTVTGAYNFATRSVDGEAAVARSLGPVRVIGAARAMSSPYVGDDARFAIAGGAVLHVAQRSMPVTLSGDVGVLLDRRAGEDVAWSAGVTAGLPHTSFVFGVHASNALTTTIEGASLGTARTRYAFELNAPVELPGFVLGWFTPRERAAESVRTDVATAPATRVRISGYIFAPAVVRIRAGETIEWQNDDAVVHTVNAENAAFESGAIRPGQSWRARFDEPGRYPYYCGPHPFMKGVIVVVAA
jgi:plastocyanin